MKEIGILIKSEAEVMIFRISFQFQAHAKKSKSNSSQEAIAKLRNKNERMQNNKKNTITGKKIEPLIRKRRRELKIKAGEK